MKMVSKLLLNLTRKTLNQILGNIHEKILMNFYFGVMCKTYPQLTDNLLSLYKHLLEVYYEQEEVSTLQ